MSMNCEVITDLLPLYHDGVCSSESKVLVEEHLKNCISCQKELKKMDAALDAVCFESQSVNSFGTAESVWKKSQKKSFIKRAVITMVICALLFACLYGLTQWKCLSVSATNIEITNLSQLSDGSIIFNLSLNNQKSSYAKFTTTKNGEFYITPMRSVIEESGNMGIYNNHCKYIVFPAGFKTSQPEHPGIFIAENTQYSDFTIHGDIDLLQSALVNLIDNASKASQPGQTVCVFAAPDIIEVKDQGCGIPSDAVTHITEAFYMADRSRSKKQGGVGLGLALVQEIVNAHGAVLQIESTQNAGTTMRILFKR